ncbi:MAG: flavin reductase family protein [Bacteroidetes bacterium]|nr:flavin reductase family protein [Bacteroidota bacterium]
MQLDPKNLTQLESYKILTGSILPRPIAFVSTQDEKGRLNLAPFSFFTIAATLPPTLVFCPLRRGPLGEKKDTLRNIEATGEYVVNIVSESFVEQMNRTSADVPPEEDEFLLSGLTPADSSVVKPKRVLESPISFECRLTGIVPAGNDGPGGGSLIIGEVVMAHIREDVISNFRINVEKVKPLGRLAGNFYCRVTDLFELNRPE